MLTMGMVSGMSILKVDHGPLSLHTESFGNQCHHVIVLISGAGATARFWSNDFCEQIVEAGYYVIRFDHRDQGLSSAVNYEHYPYTVKELAGDVIAILDAYHIQQAHIVGHSMGGTIAQLLAIYFITGKLSAFKP